MKFFLVVYFFSLQTWALSDREVVNSVITHYPLIDQSILKAESAEGDVTAAKGAFDTKLKFKTRLWRQHPYNNEYYETYLQKQTAIGGASVLAGHRQGAGNFNYYDLKKDTSSAGQIFAGIVMPILRGFQTDSYRTNLAINRIRKDQAEQEVLLKKLMYVHKALTTYYKWVLEFKKVEINRQLLELAETRHEMIEKKYKAGDSDRLKVIDNLRQINKRQGELIKSEVELRKRAADLALFVRDNEGNPILPTTIGDPEQVLLKPTIANQGKENRTNPQIKILSFEQEVNKAEYDLNSQARLPGLNVGVTGARELSDRPAYGQHILEVGVNFDFPLENRKARGKTVAYHYKKKAVEKELLYIRQELDQQYQFSQVASIASKKRWELSQSEYDNSKKIAEGERRKLFHGASDLFVVNLREQDQADVDVKRWSALYEYHQYNLDASLFAASLPIEKLP